MTAGVAVEVAALVGIGVAITVEALGGGFHALVSAIARWLDGDDEVAQLTAPIDPELRAIYRQIDEECGIVDELVATPLTRADEFMRTTERYPDELEDDGPRIPAGPPNQMIWLP